MWYTTGIGQMFIDKYINPLGFYCSAWCQKTPSVTFVFSWTFVFKSRENENVSHEFYF